MKTILAADIGGTNARFALFTSGPDGLAMGEKAQLPSREAESFSGLLKMLEQSAEGIRLSNAHVTSLAVAGPIHGGMYCKPPNLDWDVDISNPSVLGLGRTVMCNDFTAQAWAVMTDAMDQAETILPGTPDPAGTMAVIGAGTGLGKAALVPDVHGGYAVMPTEGGHALFPFQNEREFAFQQFMRKRTGKEQIIGDMVVSGSGLSAVHAFLTGEDIAPEMVAASLDAHPETAEWAARFYGRACRNFALETLAVGGVVITGGVAAKTPALIRNKAFAQEFLEGGAHERLLARIPVLLNSNQESGLWGAALFGDIMYGAKGGM